MKRALIVLIAVALVGCGRGTSRLNRDQQQYDVVQEGSASGVTSTINAPGETTPPITGTNADTTTAFSLPMGGVPSNGQPGTIAGTLPTDTTGAMVYPPGMPPRPVAQHPRPVAQQPVQVQQPAMTSAQPEQPQQTERQPEPQPAQPSTQSPPAPETTTQAPPPPPETNTAPPPEKKKDEKKHDDQQEQEQPPDEQPAPPPPVVV